MGIIKKKGNREQQISLLAHQREISSKSAISANWLAAQHWALFVVVWLPLVGHQPARRIRIHTSNSESKREAYSSLFPSLAVQSILYQNSRIFSAPPGLLRSSSHLSALEFPKKKSLLPCSFLVINSLRFIT